MATIENQSDYGKIITACRTILISDDKMIEEIIGEYDGKLLIALSAKFINDFTAYRRNFISQIINDLNSTK